tara:strand:- start:493 stop:747 length:255 start_codon:yes stop_codon:yes gene_type:complete
MSICLNKNEVPMIPDACPVCKVLLRSLDKLAFEYCGACADCAQSFVDVNKGAWDSGWRPSKGEIVARLQKRKEEPFFYVNDEYI